MNYYLLFLINLYFFISNVFAAEFIITLTGKAEVPYFKEYEKNKIYMLYKNEGQFTTNSSMFGTQVAAASIEIIDGVQTQNVFGAWKDSYGNEGFVKSVRPQKNKIKGNMLGDRIGSNVASFIVVSGSGPWEELVGITFLGAYLEMGEGHFIWQGKAEVSDKSFQRINDYIKEEE